MKITLPSGIVIESDEAVTIDGTVIAPASISRSGSEELVEELVEELEGLVEEPPTRALRSVPTERERKEAVLSDRMRETLNVLHELGGPAGIPYVADRLGIKREAVRQRLIRLHDLGLVDRVSSGIYRATEEVA